MIKFKHAVFCYYLIKYNKNLHYWLVTITGAVKSDGWLNQDEQNLDNKSPLKKEKLDFDTVLHILSGDAHFEKNKTDVAKLEKEVNKKVTTLWDTDPIFLKYPKLKTLARNLEFEKMWAKMQQKQK